jgi:hypothetical protein
LEPDAVREPPPRPAAREFTIGTELHRSQSLALVQTLLLYHLVSTRAEIGAGVDPHSGHSPNVTGADSALHA